MLSVLLTKVALKQGRGYYHVLYFHIHTTTASGKQMELVDGGSVDWMLKLLRYAKKQLVISGIGSEWQCTVVGNVSAA